MEAASQANSTPYHDHGLHGLTARPCRPGCIFYGAPRGISEGGPALKSAKQAVQWQLGAPYEHWGFRYPTCMHSPYPYNTWE